MKLNKLRLLELLNKSKKCCVEGKDLYSVDEIKYLELFKYFVLLEDTISWASRYEYLKVIKLFVNRIIDGTEFIRQYSQIRRSNDETLDILQNNLEAEATVISSTVNKIDFELYSKSRGFGEIILMIESEIDLFNPD